MNPDQAKLDQGRQDRNRYVVLILTLSYTACALGLIVENLIVGWEPWAIPFLCVSAAFAWWIHLMHPFSETGRIYALATIYYGITFYQGVHESSLFDISLIICFVFFLFSLADELVVYNIGLVVYFSTLIYQITVHYGLAVFSDTLTTSRIVLHVLIVVLSSRFAKSMISGRQRGTETQGMVIRRLAELNHRTEDFMANVSHELRTPINAVTGFSSILMERDGITGEEMNAIYRAGCRLSDQVGDILDYTEIDRERVILAQETYGVYSIVNDVININRVSRGDREGETVLPEIIVDVDAAVPAKLKGDPRRLKKILLHLLDNAVKFTKEGGIYIHIYAEPRGYGVNLCLEVSDTGIGIPMEELMLIQRGFYQADSSRTRSAGGMGLGLAIVYGFVRIMGGFVAITSTVGQGTSVRISIPQEVVDPAPCMSIAEPDRYTIAGYLKTEKYRVPMVREFYESMLMHLVRGLHVPVRRSGSLQELKEIVSEITPSHVFLGSQEYEEDPAYFMKLARSTEVIVVADQNFSASRNSGVIVLRKPFYGFPIAGILNELNISGAYVDSARGDDRVEFPGLSALVVDDEEMNLVVARGIFTGYGMKVTTALSGKESLKCYEKENFDVIFMDHMMPEMDGVEAMKLLKQAARAKNRETRFVALTANAVSGAREMFHAEGFDGFIAKPIETVELERVLCRILPAGKVRITKGTGRNVPGQISQGYNGDELGIGNCFGDRDLYNRLRRIFVEELPHNLRVFRSAYATGTMEPYSVRLRSLRDGARIIGEEELVRRARRLEQAIADNDSVRIQKGHADLCTYYEESVAAIRERLEKEGTFA